MRAALLASGALVASWAAAGLELHVGHFGDSTCATTYLPEEKRVHAQLGKRLQEAYTNLKVHSHNLAKDGDFIYRFLNRKDDWGPKWKKGQGPRPGRYHKEVKGKVKRLDVAFIRYGQNDMKQYEPDEFEKRLVELIDTLRRDFPGVLVILETGTYFDPAHYTWAGINKRFDSYWEVVREVAAKRDLSLVDNFKRWEQETKKGNWDLRIRKDGTLGASKDKEHEGDKSWFANGHPNEKGVKTVADEEFEVLSQILEKRRIVRPARRRERTTSH